MTPLPADVLTDAERAEIAAAYDKWRVDSAYEAPAHAIFGGGYLAGKRTARADALALREACNGLLGLFQLIDGRDDIPAEAKAAFMNNHRIIDAQLLLARALASDPPGGG